MAYLVKISVEGDVEPGTKKCIPVVGLQDLAVQREWQPAGA
jgi:hypothetical protein